MLVAAVMVGYVIMGLITMRIVFLVDTDEKGNGQLFDEVGEYIFIGALWPLALVVLLGWFAYLGIERFIFAPTKAQRAFAEKQAAKKKADRERADTICELLKSAPELVREEDRAWYTEHNERQRSTRAYY